MVTILIFKAMQITTKKESNTLNRRVYINVIVKTWNFCSTLKKTTLEHAEAIFSPFLVAECLVLQLVSLLESVIQSAL